MTFWVQLHEYAKYSTNYLTFCEYGNRKGTFIKIVIFYLFENVAHIVSRKQYKTSLVATVSNPSLTQLCPTFVGVIVILLILINKVNPRFWPR